MCVLDVLSVALDQIHVLDLDLMCVLDVLSVALDQIRVLDLINTARTAIYGYK